MSRAYAIYDTQDHCWLGDKDGVRVYRDTVVNGKPFPGELQAKLAMTIINEQFGCTRPRFRMSQYGGHANKLRDEITAPITGTEAIAQIEARAK